MFKIYTLKTEKKGIYDITDQVLSALQESGVEEGLCLVYCPHTTGAITINENADPDVKTDLLYGLSESLPDRKNFRHREGNSAAHLQAVCIGSSECLIIEDSKLQLGTWQGIFFVELDGPRTRQFYVKCIRG